MGDLVLTDATLSAVVTNLLQAAAGVKGALNGAFLGLIAAPFTPDRRRVLADVTEPTYATYARQAVAWGTPEFMSDGEWGTVATGVYTFRTAPGDPALVVYGVLLASAATAGSLLATALMEDPYPLATSSDVCVLVPRLVLPLGNAWGKFAQLG